MTLYLNPTQVRLMQTGQIEESALLEISRRNKRKLKNWGMPANKPKYQQPKLANIRKPWSVPDKPTNAAKAAYRRYALMLFGNRCMACDYVGWYESMKVRSLNGLNNLDMSNAQVLCKKCKDTDQDCRTDAQKQILKAFTE